MTDIGYQNPVVNFNSTSEYVTIASDYKAIFLHTDKENCPLSSIALMKKENCALELAPQQKVTLGPGPDYSIKAFSQDS